jgi:hypothetical protein
MAGVSHEKHLAVLEWARAYRGANIILPGRLALAALARTYSNDLWLYYTLCRLSRAKTAPVVLVEDAGRQVFRVRVSLEKSLRNTTVEALERSEADFDILLSHGFYGASRKQGVSVRMPLLTCMPTALCAGACYAHDLMDAMPTAVLRGVVNGIVAERFEHGDQALQQAILTRLQPQTQQAVYAALRAVRALRSDWTRRPFIRLSHVGEIAAFPQFANALARQVRELSGSEVDCVIYTRHLRARDLDPELLIINFSLDKSSTAFRSWAPPGARIVFAAFGGELSSEAEVNFLEHHRWTRVLPVGSGTICPTTLPETKVHSCDAVRCNRCFQPPVVPIHLQRPEQETATATTSESQACASYAS